MLMKKYLLFLALFCFLVPLAQAKDDSVPTNWLSPAKPFLVAGPIYYVGTRGLAVYLIKTNAGLILLSGALPSSAALVRESVRTLGFKWEDVKLLLVSHAHADHVGTLAEIKKATAAKVVAMAAEKTLLESGGKTDYLYANEPSLHFTPVSPDQILKDGEVVTLGDIQLIAHWTPGHTRGCTTWEMLVESGGRKYDVVFLDGTTVNPGTRFTKKPSYPEIAADYRRTFQTLESLHPDIFLAYHAEAFDLEGKVRRASAEGVQAWVDPVGYRNRVARNKGKFEKLLSDEK